MKLEDLPEVFYLLFAKSLRLGSAVMLGTLVTIRSAPSLKRNPPLLVLTCVLKAPQAIMIMVIIYIYKYIVLEIIYSLTKKSFI